MKNFMLMLGLLVGTGFYQSSYGQVNVNVNIGNQPIWGPTGYDYVNYYYLPDLNIYYNVPQQQWIYLNGNRWITTTVLPPQYTNYDLYRMHKVVINDNQPYLRNAVYQKEYASFKGRYDQQPIRDSRDSRYYVINNHPMHNQMGNRGGNARPDGNRQNDNRSNGDRPGIQSGRTGGRQQDQQGGRRDRNDRNDRSQGEHRGQQ